MARHPGKQWRIPALWPEELSGIFVQAGFARSAISQSQMELGLDSSATPLDASLRSDGWGFAP